MKQAEIIATLAFEEDISKRAVSRMLDRLREILTADLKEHGRAAIPGVGTLSVVQRAARKCRNPKTQEQIDVPACKAVKFKAAPALKCIVNEDSVNDAE